MRRSRHRFALAAVSCLLSATTWADDGVLNPYVPRSREIYTMICWQNDIPVLTYPNLTSFEITQGGITAETTDGWRVRLTPPLGFSLEKTACTVAKITAPRAGL